MPQFSLHLLKMALVATGFYLLGQTTALRHFPSFPELDFPTESLSFNASLQLAETSAPADIYVIGSSIAMRNILAEEIENATSRTTRTISGLGMPTSMLVPTARKLGIRDATIVFPLHIGALGVRPSAKDELYKVERWWTPPPLDATWQRLRLVSLPNTERGHIQFDAWGNAPFSDDARVQTSLEDQPLDEIIDTTGLHNLLVNASEFAREHHCKVVFTAHDSRVSRQLNGETLEPFAARIANEFPELEWINLRAFQLPDSLFKDNNHLVESGARMLTRELCARTDF